jgi:hypothetical protein
VYKGEHNVDSDLEIIWRYNNSRDIGEKMVKNSKLPVRYMQFMERDEVNEFHHRQIICSHCRQDSCFLMIEKDHHCGSVNLYTTCFRTATQKGMPLLQNIEYSGKIVVLTISRSSSSSYPSHKLEQLKSQHEMKYKKTCLHLIQNCNIDAESIIHGQRYHKCGNLKSTIIIAKTSAKRFLPFLAIHNDINETFYMADSIFISLRVTADLSGSPYYLSQFLSVIRPELINKLFFVLFNWNDCKPLLDNVRVIIPATGLLYLCDPEHLFPAEYWKEQQENVISALTSF